MSRNRRYWALSAALLLGLLVADLGCAPRTMAPYEPPMTVRRGDEALRYHDYESAIQYYKVYLDRTWKGDYTALVAYQCALAEYRLKRYQAALATLNDLQKRYPEGQWVQVQALRGDIEQAQGNDTLALVEWDAGWDLGGEDDREKLRLRIVTVARRMAPDKLAQARELVVHEDVENLLYSTGDTSSVPVIAAPMPEIDESLAEYDVADYDVVAAPAERRPGSYRPGSRGAPGKRIAVPPTRASSEPMQPLADTASPPVEVVGVESQVVEVEEPAAPAPARIAAAPAVTAEMGSGTARIGCLLPMSGRHADLGTRAWRAVQMAFGEEAQRLVLKDGGGDPAATRGALSDLWRDRQVVAVIGPVRDVDAQAVAPLAEQDRLVLLPLSQQEGISGPFVLQVGGTPAKMVDELLNYAVDVARLRRFGVLYPDDAGGRGLLAAFRDAANRRGVTIVGVSGYPPGSPIVNRYAQTLFQWRKRHDIDAVFLADTSGMAAGLAAFLQEEMPDVTLLGVQGWEALAGEVGGGQLNGVLFADGFYAASTRTATREFVEQYRELYGETPDAIEARAYDAALLTKRALDAGATTRSAMLDHLRSIGEFDGATGALRVTQDGLKPSIFLLRLHDGRIQEVG